MRHNRIRLAAALGGLLLLAACGGGSSSPMGPGVTAGVSADIDGVHWTAVAASVIRNQNNIVAIGAADASGMGIGMAFLDQGTGTYDIAQQQGVTNFSVSLSGGQSWAASGLQGTGTLQITTLTANHIVGTFSFTAPGFSGTPVPTTTKVITNGKIDVTY